MACFIPVNLIVMVQVYLFRTATLALADAAMMVSVIRIRHPLAPIVVVRVGVAIHRAALFAGRPAYAGSRGEAVRLQEEIGVAMIAAWLMPVFAAILIPHLMLGNGTVIMIALFAMGLTPTIGRPAVVMGFRGLRAAYADALVGIVVHIRPGVGVRHGFRRAADTAAGMGVVPVVLPVAVGVLHGLSHSANAFASMGAVPVVLPIA